MNILKLTLWLMTEALGFSKYNVRIFSIMMEEFSWKHFSTDSILLSREDLKWKNNKLWMFAYERIFYDNFHFKLFSYGLPYKYLLYCAKIYFKDITVMQEQNIWNHRFMFICRVLSFCLRVRFCTWRPEIFFEHSFNWKSHLKLKD